MEDEEQVTVFDGMRDGSHVFSCIDGHSYHKHREMTGGRWSLRCIYYRRRRKCFAKASFSQNGTEFRPGRIGYHNHVPPNNLFHQRRFRSSVLGQCRKQENITMPLKRLYDRVRRHMRLTPIQIGGLTYVKLRSSMVRARSENLPPVPHSLSELADIIDDPQYDFLTKTLDARDRVYIGKYGQTRAGTRCIMFTSRRLLQYMSSPDTPVLEVLSDATFVLPTVIGSRQIWNICTIRNNHVIVLVRFVMQTKSEACYRVCLEALKAIVPDFKPQSVMCDFEPAQANAWEAVYPLATVSGCLFHSSKAIALKAQELGLIPLIRENEVVDGIVRSLCAIALLPVRSLKEGLRSVAERAFRSGHFAGLQSLFFYMRRTWFRPDFMRRLSVYRCSDRTSNACESANATLVRTCGSKKPSVYTFLHALRELEDSTWHDAQDITNGYTCSRGRPLSAIANDEIISNLTNQLDRGQISVRLFLEKASRRIQGVYDMVLNL